MNPGDTLVIPGAAGEPDTLVTIVAILDDDRYEVETRFGARLIVAGSLLQ